MLSKGRHFLQRAASCSKPDGPMVVPDPEGGDGGRRKEGEHEKGNRIVNMNFHCCRMQPTRAVPPPARLLPQPTVALTTTVTGVKIKVEDLLHVPRWLGP